MVICFLREAQEEKDPNVTLGLLAQEPQKEPDFFSFLYLKKIKISKIYGGFEKFQNYTPVAPCLGPVALWLGDRT